VGLILVLEKTDVKESARSVYGKRRSTTRGSHG
jgi:hypothetical protein